MGKKKLEQFVFQEEVVHLANLVECSVGVWPIKYLGFPLGGNPTKKSFWEPVVTKVAKRLDGWKRAFLSRGDVSR